MPRFTFPMSGRRQKQQSAIATALLPQANTSKGGPPLTKAQRILGLTDISVDAQGGANWDAQSHTGTSTSINASDSTYTETRARGAGGNTHRTLEEDCVAEEEDLDGDDEESGILPLALDQKLSLANARHQSIADFHHAVSDASSVRRRQSTSTINSYYDKSKQPLRISQQTSSSAMAMGLLSTRSNGVAQNSSDVTSPTSRRNDGPERKKPARLDLSHLLPKVKRHSSLNSPQPALLGPDMITKSPSLVSDYGEGNLSARLQGRPGSFRKSLRSLSSRKPKETQCSIEQSERRRSDTAHSLYDHYEQQSMYRDALAEVQEEEFEVPLVLGSEIHGAAPSPSTFGLHTPYSTSTSPSGAHSKSSLAYTQNESMPATPLTSVMTPDLKAPDCSESISSRHTRTSLASKRTTQSAFDIDLKQTSVLSLSSDSEGDEEPLQRTPRTSSTHSSPPARQEIESPGDPPTTQLPPIPGKGSRRSEVPDLQTAKLVGICAPAMPRKESRPYTASLFPKVQQHPPKSTHRSRSSDAPTSTATGPVINSRSSSLYSATASRAPIRTSQRQPTRSLLTIDSVARGTTPANEYIAWTKQKLEAQDSRTKVNPSASNSSNNARSTRSSVSAVSGFTVYESKTTRPVPSVAETLASSRKSRLTQDLGSTTHLSISVASVSDQPTPPVSPSASEFNAQSPDSHARKEPTSESSADVTPVRGSTSDTPSPYNQGSSPVSKYSPPSPSSTSSRFMAVTRQEEMLLAALRLKRARMRESIIAEFETEERDRVIDAFPAVPGGTEATETSGSTEQQQPDKASSHRRQHSSISTLSGFESSLAPRPQQNPSKQRSVGRSASAQSQRRAPMTRNVSGSQPKNISPLLSAEGASGLGGLDAFPMPERLPTLTPHRPQTTSKQWWFDSDQTADSSKSCHTSVSSVSPLPTGVGIMFSSSRESLGARGDTISRESRGRSAARSQSAMGNYPGYIASPSTFMSQPRNKAVRISAVGGPTGRVGVELGLWGDDG